MKSGWHNYVTGTLENNVVGNHNFVNNYVTVTS